MNDDGRSLFVGSFRKIVRTCRKGDHDWQPIPIRYEIRSTITEIDGLPHRVPVTWVTDEACSRCGMESRWPT